MGRAGRGRARGSGMPMGSAAYKRKGFKVRAAACRERPIGGASCRQQRRCHANPPPPPGQKACRVADRITTELSPSGMTSGLCRLCENLASWPLGH